MKQYYILYCFYRHLLSKSVRDKYDGKWIPQSEMMEVFKAELRAALAQFGVDSKSAYDPLATEQVEYLLHEGGIIAEGDQYSGEYFQIDTNRRNAVLAKFLNENEIAIRVQALGSSALQRALKKIAEEDGFYQRDLAAEESEIFEEAANLQAIPAADRVVNLNHNQISELDERSSEIISEIEQLNRIDEEPGLREIIVGQLKAGRELIRAGAFRVYVLQQTLIDALLFLAKRYEKEAIGGLAGALAAELIKLVGSGQ